MTVLVTAASKHGATLETADAVARVLDECEVQNERVGIGSVTELARYEAVVLGSAVYMGHWLDSARTFVDRHADELSSRHTWLFSSGPIGDPPRPRADEAVSVDDLVERTHAVEHRLFAGKIDRSKLSFPERAVLRVVGAKEGDYRDWDEIASWAKEIAARLH